MLDGREEEDLLARLDVGAHPDDELRVALEAFVHRAIVCGSASVLAALEHRVARVGVEAGGGEERRAGTAGEERVAAGQAPRPARARGPRSGARDRATARPACARTRRAARSRCRMCRGRSRALSRYPARACPPDELGTGEQELLVEVVARGGDDSRRARAPLELALAAPVREPVLDASPRARGRLRTRRASDSLRESSTCSSARTLPASPCDGADPAEARAPELLRPEAVRVAAGDASASRPTRGPGSSQSMATAATSVPGRPPHQILGLVGEVGADAADADRLRAGGRACTRRAGSPSRP